MSKGRITALALGFTALFGAMASAQTPLSEKVDAEQFLGTELMQSPHHRVAPHAISDGYMHR